MAKSFSSIEYFGTAFLAFMLGMASMSMLDKPTKRSPSPEPPQPLAAATAAPITKPKPTTHNWKYVTAEGYVYEAYPTDSSPPREVLVKYLGQPFGDEYRFAVEGTPRYVFTCFAPCKAARRILYAPAQPGQGLRELEETDFLVTPGSVLDRATRDALAGALTPELERNPTDES